MIENKAVINRLKQLKSSWELKRKELIILFNSGYMPSQEDLMIYCPGAHHVVDWSLIYDEGIFRYKLFDTLLKLYLSSYQDVVNFQNIIIDYQIKHGKARTLTEQELVYTGVLMNLNSWILKVKFGLSNKDRRDVTSGNKKSKTHFTML